MAENDIKILVCYHKPYNIYKNDLYLPIQVGRARNNFDLGIQTDNMLKGKECDNISNLNHLFCETTAMYWAWKNIRTLYPNIKYVGLCHYRRYFSTENHTIYDRAKTAMEKTKAAGKVLTNHHNHTIVLDTCHGIKTTEAERFQRSDDGLRKVIYSSDIIATKPVRIINSSVEDYFDTIGRSYIDLMKDIVKSEFSQFSDSLNDVLDGSLLNAANMIILRTELLDEYCTYVFGVMERHLQLVKDKGICIDPMNEKIYSRIPGYLGELLTCSYIRFKSNTCKVNYTGKYFVED